ncbi:adenylate/guanylate cyclase domain-containing protein [Aquabacterium sp.]|jgi:adenylate cyclase|uniref:adenylate/guanylate cyclase domain-containing protein n=1 Tax=Aquabacterium sp. TaxID=1872578 RepID=UPI0024883F24|nr:adenylate/guanylate cyclase domain-containing protein [Aquabacterium sp.]MDI1347891.1 adenylate/guanylate cyclase domain-containing protein [Aquabacterium sp.]
MGTTKERAILFADLRGSTALYLKLGNTEAATVVTQSLSLLGQIVAKGGGRVVKTLGDGLMAVFDQADPAVEVAVSLHDSLERLAPITQHQAARHGAIRLKVAIAWGEMVEVDGDCFGDAVNVAARLLDLAGDHETLTTGPLLRELPSDQQERFRSIDKLHLRGRKEPVPVLRMEARRFGDTLSTVIMDAQETDMPDGIRLNWLGTERVFSTASMPLVLGRSPQASFCVSDSRVSRSHARIESHSGHIYLSDLSYNGTHVRFDGDDQALTLRRGTCTLHGSGVISLGAPSTDPTSTQIRFDVLSFSDTLPQC